MIERLYHGGINLFEDIDVLKGKGFKDFGQGFYTTATKEHAIRLAKRNKRIEEERLKRIGVKSKNINTYLYEYDFNMSLLKQYHSKVFTEADREWVLFVLENRGCRTKVHNYDIVNGPTADDNTRITFNTYRLGGYGDPKSDKAINILIDFLEPDNLPLQIYFGSNEEIKELVFKGVNKII